MPQPSRLALYASPSGASLPVRYGFKCLNFLSLLWLSQASAPGMLIRYCTNKRKVVELQSQMYQSDKEAIAMTVITAKWTIDEYHRMIAAGILNHRRVELLKGEIIEMSPEGEPHAYFSSEAGNYLIRLLGDRAMIRSAKPITLPNDSEPEPDIAIVQKLGREYLEHHPYPENIFWLIEYSDSSLDKDLETKTKVYAEVKIPEYWVANLKRRQLVVFREPQEREYASKSTLTGGTIYPLAFPDLAVSVDLIVSI